MSAKYEVVHPETGKVIGKMSKGILRTPLGKLTLRARLRAGYTSDGAARAMQLDGIDMTGPVLRLKERCPKQLSSSHAAALIWFSSVLTRMDRDSEAGDLIIYSAMWAVRDATKDPRPDHLEDLEDWLR